MRADSGGIAKSVMSQLPECEGIAGQNEAGGNLLFYSVGVTGH